MTRFLTPILATALALMSISAPAPAQNNYFAPAVVYTDDGEDRLVDDEIAGGQLAMGHFFSNHFALEGLLGSSHL